MMGWAWKQQQQSERQEVQLVLKVKLLGVWDSALNQESGLGNIAEQQLGSSGATFG